MRIKTFDHRPVQAIIRGSLDRCFDNRSNEYRAAVIMEGLSKAGFEIVPKGEPAKPAVAPVMGNAAVLTPEGERIIAAIAAGDFTGISDDDFTAFQGIRRKVVQASEVAFEEPDDVSGDGRTGEEGDVWALYDARHRARYDYRSDPDLQRHINAAQG